MELKATRSMIRVGDREIPVYSGAMKHRDLYNLTHVFTFNLEADDLSYQRKLDQRNLKNIAGAYQRGEPVFGSILLNGRTYQGESVFRWRSADGIFGILEIPDERVLSVMDGQHRIATYTMLPDSRLEFPVIIYDGLTLLEENKAFLSLNFLAKKLTKSHSQVVALQVNQNPTTRDQLAAFITMKLSRRPVSPWYNRLATEANLVNRALKPKKGKPMKYLTTFSGLAYSIARDLLTSKETPFADLTNERKVDVLISYWRAVRHSFPETWTTPALYRLTTGFGPIVMHRLLVQHFAKRLDLETVTEIEFVQALLPLVNLGGSELWSINGPLKGYSSYQHAQFVTDAMRKAMEAGRVEVLLNLLRR